jgi:predicted N-acetyltransferase YhbS
VSFEYQPVSPQDYELIRRFLAENGWAHRVADPERFAKMMQKTDRSIAVWNEGDVVGFGRALCDDVSNGYLSMIVVAESARGQGIGREIVQRLMGPDPEITWMLRAGHGSEGFWSKMGFAASEVAMERTRQGK